ncbi:hypothetical protein SpCBS45565_g00078 [Spizellomyces sp. 'palustris']|nr:hypothetical protein SpCBS45565_g00078 [Spizellomyces sp. 'palustris']
MTYSWRRLANADATGVDTPVGRSSHSLNIIGDRAYIFSGEREPRKPIDARLHIFDLVSQRWAGAVEPLAATAPAPRVGHATATLGDCIYLFGGRGGPEMSPMEAELFSFDTTSDTWTKLQVNGDIPAPRSYHSMTASEHHVYLFGGCLEEGRANDFYRFSPETFTWERLPSNPDLVARGGAGLAYLGDQVIVYGGFNGTELNDIWAFNTKNSTWERIILREQSDAPCPRSVAGFVALPAIGKVVTFMGEKGPSPTGHAGAGRYAKDVWILDIHSNATATWMHIPPADPSQLDAPTPRGWMTDAPWRGESIIMHGG